MATTDSAGVAFREADTRNDEMHRTIEAWLEELAEGVDDAQATDEFQAWLDVQSRFHDYSYRNTLLIKQQCPEAIRVAGYRTWQREFDRHVKEGEQAIWIWAPIIAKRCPACENSPSYHEKSGCEYDETAPDEWSKGLMGFKPVPVFDVSQTAGEPLPELDTAATGDAGNLVRALVAAAEPLGVDVRIRPARTWNHGSVKGVCRPPNPESSRPLVEAKARANDADLAVTLLHEYAHARLHIDGEETGRRPKREIEAEAVAYVSGRYFGLDTSNSAFYLAAWQGEDVARLEERLSRISSTAAEVIDAIDP